jgi:hypothetical protein
MAKNAVRTSVLLDICQNLAWCDCTFSRAYIATRTLAALAIVDHSTVPTSLHCRFLGALHGASVVDSGDSYKAYRGR